MQVWMKGLVGAVLVAVLAVLTVQGVVQAQPRVIQCAAGTKIQAAVDYAGNGDIIHIAPGVYAETVSIRGKKLTLMGSLVTITKDLIIGDYSTKDWADVTVSIDGLIVDTIRCYAPARLKIVDSLVMGSIYAQGPVTIANTTIKGEGVQASGDSAELVMVNSSVIDSRGVGVHVEYWAQVTLVGCAIVGSARSGIFVGSPEGRMRLLIRDCVIAYNGQNPQGPKEIDETAGIFFYNSDDGFASAQIVDCTIIGNRGWGIADTLCECRYYGGLGTPGPTRGLDFLGTNIIEGNGLGDVCLPP